MTQKNNISYPADLAEQFCFGNKTYNQNLVKDYALMSQIASMYYVEGMQQPEIAEKLFFSRSKVSRMLSRAKELGIVNIQVARICERVPSVEKQLKNLFYLKDAVVITNFPDMNENETLETVSQFGALYISNLLKENSVFGISNGNAVNNIVHEYQKLQNCSLQMVQLIGSASNAYRAIESREMVNQLTNTYPGKAFFLNTPLYMDNSFARAQLLMDPSISATFDMMKKCDILLTGVGSFYSDQPRRDSMLRQYITPEHTEELARKKAVGCLCAYFYDINGNYIDCEWNRKLIAIPYQTMRSNPMVIAAACGQKKVLPILGGLRSGSIKVMITDMDTASKVIDENSRR